MLMYLKIFLFCVSSVFSQTSLNRNKDDIAKDLIIENTNQCNCVPYYLCDSNNDIITNGANIFDPRIGADEQPTSRIQCTNKVFACCKLKNSDVKVEPKNPTVENNFTIWKNPNQTRTAGCGYQRTILNPRIIDSDFSSTIIGEIPWIVAIFKEKPSQKGNFEFKCAGSLIRPNVVLTATHCIVSVSTESLKVVITGESLLETLTPNEDECKRNVLKIIKHPEYYSGGLYNDIALLVLSKEFVFENLPVNTVCLPENENQNFIGSSCIAAGWGTGKLNDQSDRPLKKVALPIIEFEQCQNDLRGTRLGSEFELHRSFMCAGGEPNVDTCKGDGGGPLMCSDDKTHSRYVQVGIVSWGIDCGKGNVPGIYTDIRKFRTWINEVLNRENIRKKC